MNFVQYKYKKSHIKAASCFEVLEVFFDGLLDFGDGVIGGGGAEHGDTLLVHHELGEVPLDGVDEEPSLLSLEKSKEWVRVTAVDVDFGEHVEGDVVLRHKLLDLLFGAGLLASKLVAGEPKDA